jgi:hypothetical protein
MGHYTAHAVRLRLNANTPQNILDWLRMLCDKPKDGSKPPSHGGELIGLSAAGVIGAWGLMHGSSSSFPHWNSRSLKQDENGVWELLTYSSSRYTSIESLFAFLEGLRPFMIFDHGDIFYRELFEMQIAERVVYFDREKDAFLTREGYAYSLPGEYRDPLDCPDHGWNDPELGEGEEPEPFNPPWNVVELQAQLHDRLAQRAGEQAKAQAGKMKKRRK